jgi:hypothetical protein
MEHRTGKLRRTLMMMLDLIAVNSLRSGIRRPSGSRHRVPEHGRPETRTGPRGAFSNSCGGRMRRAMRSITFTAFVSTVAVGHPAFAIFAVI